LVCFRTRPHTLIASYGSRGWRFQWIALGSAWAHFYLACSAVGLGCCGLGGVNDDSGLSTSDSEEVRTASFLMLGALR
jgi:nitroreductase